MPSEDRNDHDQIEHMPTPILAIDVWWSWPLISLNISPPTPTPPPQKKKSPWEHDGIACYMYVLHYLLS